MKKLLVLSFIIIQLTGFSQEEIKLTFYIKDNLNRIDSVVLGRHENGTSGIDTNLNEVDLYGVPYDSIDIRSIQRDTENHECLTQSLFENVGDPLYFENNIDLKIDLRENVIFDQENNCFEINFKAIEYPIELIFDFRDYPIEFTRIYWGGIFDTECTFKGEINMEDPYIDTIRIESDTSINKIILKIDHEVEIYNNYFSNKIQVFPNPSKERLIEIKGIEKNGIQMEIYSISGKLILNKKLNQEKRIDLRGLKINSGFYIYKLKVENKILKTGKLILE